MEQASYPGRGAWKPRLAGYDQTDQDYNSLLVTGSREMASISLREDACVPGKTTLTDNRHISIISAQKHAQTI